MYLQSTHNLNRDGHCHDHCKPFVSYLVRFRVIIIMYTPHTTFMKQNIHVCFKTLILNQIQFQFQP